ncbi:MULTISPECIES: alanine racemase [unclassified Sphingomonas]|uniref:alanine racemase n=1 Tax=unclassified Sphingomonas TaxID=196159 RepID=UPI0006F9DAAE|nr:MULTISPECIES: alanine racemase [unclassified Sphingomonas]KQM57270.1 alanine racemase [Sphingomonas sp. Leaf16]KQN10445.1 alanine racemase [Sphingomonas sp. Leaf29]KQN18246.1 alanine racemase [Sphingomonas sp. Leaf32]
MALLTIDLNALAANYRTIVATAAPARAAGVVKADGYGLGAAIVADALYRAGCRDFFVALAGEASALRPTLPADARLFVLNGIAPGEEAALIAADAVPVLNCPADIARWAAAGRIDGRRLPAAIQVDSGMSRLGLTPGEMAAIAADPGQLAGIDVVLTMSHLACGDEPGSAANGAQRARFDELAAMLLPAARSLANSGGSFLGGGFHGDLVRPGIALYGGAPQEGRPNPMRPVIAIDARIVQWRDVPAGTGVGYGLTSVTDHDRRIATLSYGYADGWPRMLSNRGAAYVAGVRAPIAGRVSMDSICIDVTDVPIDLLVAASHAELIGPHQTIDQVAADAGTIAYEILTSLRHRHARRIVGLREQGDATCGS